MHSLPPHIHIYTQIQICTHMFFLNLLRLSCKYHILLFHNTCMCIGLFQGGYWCHCWSSNPVVTLTIKYKLDMDFLQLLTSQPQQPISTSEDNFCRPYHCFPAVTEIIHIPNTWLTNIRCGHVTSMGNRMKVEVTYATSEQMLKSHHGLHCWPFPLPWECHVSGSGDTDVTVSKK